MHKSNNSPILIACGLTEIENTEMGFGPNT